MSCLGGNDKDIYLYMNKYTLTKLIVIACMFPLACLSSQSDFQSSLPMMIFGVCSLAAGLLAILLPETIGINLEDSLSTNEHR